MSENPYRSPTTESQVIGVLSGKRHSVHRSDRVIVCQWQGNRNSEAEWDQGRIARRESLRDLGIAPNDAREPGNV